MKDYIAYINQVEPPLTLLDERLGSIAIEDDRLVIAGRCGVEMGSVSFPLGDADIVLKAMLVALMRGDVLDAPQINGIFLAAIQEAALAE